MKFENFDQKPINIDPEPENLYDTSKIEKTSKELEEVIKQIEITLLDLENRRKGIDEREEEKRERLDTIIDINKANLLRYKKQLKETQEVKLNNEASRDYWFSKIFKGKDPEEIQ